MSSVIEFVLRPRDRKPDVEISGEAEIVIFPGVRFERVDFDADIFEPDEPGSPATRRSVNGTNLAKS